MITSLANPKLRLIRRLAAKAQRDRLGLFVCEGEDLVEAGLDTGLTPVEVLLDAERPSLAGRLPGASQVAPDVLAKAASLAHPPRAVGIFRRVDLPQLRQEDGPLVGVAAWRVSDPGNVGALLRSADALGPAFVCLSPGCADPTGPKALRAAAGAIFRVPTAPFEHGRRPWLGLVPRGGRPLATVRATVGTFVLGAERAGLPAEVCRRCDELVTIPQASQAESLNVAVAGALALYEARACSALAPALARL
ncbi:MAG: RNA methyltransferase [Actinomycetia bacterium]|nr:RNA methyltransferase [Actinomycetes bacterium]